MTAPESEAALAERLERLNAVARDASHPTVRARDAATLILIDRPADGPWRVLMGRRHLRHSFVPGAWVFPGGALEPGDARVPVAAPLAGADAARLAAHVPARRIASLPRGLAVAALRETHEEVGLVFDLALSPAGAIAAANLSRLRFVARAITPPGRPKRFDTRFFARIATPDEVAASATMALSGELDEVAWVTRAETAALNLAAITVAILDDLATRLAIDPTLSAVGDVPLYRSHHGRFQRTIIAG